MTFRQELLSAPERKWDEVLYNVKEVYVIPNRKKHDSGFGCFNLVAVLDGKRVRCGGYCDSLWLSGDMILMDCLYPERIVRIFSHRGLTITEDVSTIRIIEGGPHEVK